ncbi:hypothetical protein AK812_SmicGene43880, partial [Symbiodinium microadriaticum]
MARLFTAVGNWTMQDLDAYCLKHYGVKPDVVRNRLQFGGIEMSRTASKTLGEDCGQELSP